MAQQQKQQQQQQITAVRFARQFGGRKVRFSYHWRHEDVQFDRDKMVEGVLSCGPIMPGREFCWLFIGKEFASPLSTNSEAICKLDPSRALWTDQNGVSNGNYEVVAIDDSGNVLNIALEVADSAMKDLSAMGAFKNITASSVIEKGKNNTIIYYDVLSTADFDSIKLIVSWFSGSRCGFYSFIKG